MRLSGFFSKIGCRFAASRSRDISGCQIPRGGSDVSLPRRLLHQNHYPLAALQLREEDDVADRVAAREEHDEAVDAEAEAARGGHAALEGADEVLVDLLGVFAGLVLQGLALLERIVLLGVARAELASGDDELEDVLTRRDSSALRA